MESRTRTGQFLAAAIGVAAFALAARALAQAPGTAAVPAAPAEVVAELHAGIVAAAKDPKRSVEQRYAELEPLVARTHDLPYIAELSIRRHWAGLTDDQRERFLAAFVRLSVMTYASRFGAATSSTFEVLGSEDAGNGRVQVHAAIHRANDPDGDGNQNAQQNRLLGDAGRAFAVLLSHTARDHRRRAHAQSQCHGEDDGQ